MRRKNWLLLSVFVIGLGSPVIYSFAQILWHQYSRKKNLVEIERGDLNSRVAGPYNTDFKKRTVATQRLVEALQEQAVQLELPTDIKDWGLDVSLPDPEGRTFIFRPKTMLWSAPLDLRGCRVTILATDDSIVQCGLVINK